MAAGDVLSGMNRYPSAGWYSTGAYLISGIPFLRSRTGIANNAEHTESFLAISREVTVSCVAGKVRVCFRDDCADANSFILSAGQALTMPVRTKQVTVKCITGNADTSDWSIAATLTGIRDVAEYGKFNDDGTVGNP